MACCTLPNTRCGIAIKCHLTSPLNGNWSTTRTGEESGECKRHMAPSRSNRFVKPGAGVESSPAPGYAVFNRPNAAVHGPESR